MELREETLDEVAATGAAVPSYDRSALRRSIVHVGVGGFHRAHLATYVDDLCRAGHTEVASTRRRATPPTAPPSTCWSARLDEAVTAAVAAADDPARFLDLRPVFGDLGADQRLRRAVDSVTRSLEADGVRATIDRVLAA